MSAKKIIGIIVSVVFIAAFVFVLVWGIRSEERRVG